MNKILVLAFLCFFPSFDCVDPKAAACKSDPIPCTKSGPLCETCSSLVTCVQNGDSYEKRDTETCGSLENCIKGECVSQSLETSVFCDGTACLEFPCQDVGIYPHPFYCNKFILCVKTGDSLKTYENDCPPGWGYEISTSRCNVALGPAGCDLNVLPTPECQFAGQVGSVNGSDHLYFICQQYSTSVAALYPIIYPCQPGTVSNGQGCAKP